MRLTRVTITGADDGVDPKALYELSREFDFVEWGILFSWSRVGTARYPSDEWRKRFSVPLVGWRPKTALHLCGDPARQALAGNENWPDAWHYDRVQLNGFSKYRLPFLRCAQEWRAHHEVILQCQTEAALEHAAELARAATNVSALWDISGGRGFLDFDTVCQWPAPQGLRMGRAGGITPDNVVEILEASADNGLETWIDMETGVRTDDRFDLVKVRRVLELAKPFVEAA